MRPLAIMGIAAERRKMPRKQRTIDEPGAKERSQLLVLKTDPRLEDRVRAILAVSEGKSVSEVAASLGRSPSTVHRWLDRYESQGVHGLLDKRSMGFRKVVPQEEQREIFSQIKAGEPLMVVAQKHGISSEMLVRIIGSVEDEIASEREKAIQAHEVTFCPIAIRLESICLLKNCRLFSLKARHEERDPSEIQYERRYRGESALNRALIEYLAIWSSWTTHKTHKNNKIEDIMDKQYRRCTHASLWIYAHCTGKEYQRLARWSDSKRMTSIHRIETWDEWSKLLRQWLTRLACPQSTGNIWGSEGELAEYLIDKIQEAARTENGDFIWP